MQYTASEPPEARLPAPSDPLSDGLPGKRLRGWCATQRQAIYRIREVGQLAYCVYECLVAHADSNGWGWSYPAIPTLAYHLKVSDRAIQAALKTLESGGMIEIRRSKGGRPRKGIITSNSYRVLPLGHLGKGEPSFTVKGEPSFTHNGKRVNPASPLRVNPASPEQESVEQEDSGTGPEAAPNPRMDSRNGPGPSAHREPDALSDALCKGSPILVAARDRRLVPLPATEALAHGVFAPIKEKHLRDPLCFVEWHRRQLSTPVPVMGDTEADLLLTLATAIYAANLPAADVRKNRAAVFVSTISRRVWSKVTPYVPEARKLLDQAVSDRGPEWAGLDRDTQATALPTNDEP